MIAVTGETGRATRRLRTIRRRAIPAAIKRATDEVGRELAKPHGLIQREWNRRFVVKRPSFPASVLRVRKARVANGRVAKPTVVVNVSADAFLKAPRIRRQWSLVGPIRAARRQLPGALRAALRREIAKAKP